MGEKLIRGLGCPSCGGSLEIAQGTRVFTCKYCNANLLARGERGAQQCYVPLKVSKDEILQKIQDWFRQFRLAPGLRKEARFTDIFPVYIPFWRVDAQVVGWVLGEIKKGSGKNSHWEKVERKVMDRKEFTIPACDIGEFGVQWVDLKGDTILPFDLEKVQQQGMTFGVLTQQSDALATAEQKFQEWALAQTGVERISFSKIYAVNRSAGIVYYPLWVARYDYKGRTYQITADGETPQLLYGRAPGNTFYRVFAYVGSVMGAMLGLTTLFRSGDFDSGKAYIAIALAALAVVVWGYTQFRYGGEVKIEQKDKHKRESFEDFLPKEIGSLVKTFGQ